MAFNTLIIESRHAGADVANFTLPHSSGVAGTLSRIARYIMGYANGAYRGDLVWRTGDVKATATITITGDITATETFTLCGTTFTGRASGAAGNEFNITAGNVTATAASIATFVNASATTTVTGAVTASSALGVVTFTANVAGTIGNGLRLSESLTNATRVDFAGGTNGTSTTLSNGGAS